LPIIGTLTRDFRPRIFFLSNNFPYRPLIHGLKPFWTWLRIRKKIDYEIADLVHNGANDTAMTKNNRYSVGQFAYVCFSIDISFTGSQSQSNMRSKVTGADVYIIVKSGSSYHCLLITHILPRIVIVEIYGSNVTSSEHIISMLSKYNCIIWIFSNYLTMVITMTCYIISIYSCIYELVNK
jgi:hypothetical protein